MTPLHGDVAVFGVFFALYLAFLAACPRARLGVAAAWAGEVTRG